jgi:hypothetical protein
MSRTLLARLISLDSAFKSPCIKGNLQQIFIDRNTFVNFLLAQSPSFKAHGQVCILPSGLCRDPSKEEHPRSDTDTATIVSEIESALSQVAKTGLFFFWGGQGFRMELSCWTLGTSDFDA